MKTAAVVLSVLTLNVSGPRRVHQGWQSRRAALCAGLAAADADVAAFQEVWRDEDAEALAAAAGHAYRARAPALGLAVTSRRPVVDRASLALPGGGAVLRAGVDVDGTTADVYSARLEPGAPGGAARLGGLLASAEFVRAQSKERPFVLLGDLATSSDDKESRLFLDLIGARDLCVSHGDEMCGRTVEDGRVDYVLIPYSSRPPRETARAVLTGTVDDDGDEPRPLSAHFGLAARLDGAWLRLRLAPEPEGRLEALAAASDAFDAALAGAQSRARFAGWIPFHGAWLAARVRAEAARIAADGERARTALARETKPLAPAYE